jgi:hypothetical protein
MHRRAPSPVSPWHSCALTQHASVTHCVTACCLSPTSRHHSTTGEAIVRKPEGAPHNRAAAHCHGLCPNVGKSPLSKQSYTRAQSRGGSCDFSLEQPERRPARPAPPLARDRQAKWYITGRGSGPVYKGRRRKDNSRRSKELGHEHGATPRSHRLAAPARSPHAQPRRGLCDPSLRPCPPAPLRHVRERLQDAGAHEQGPQVAELVKKALRLATGVPAVRPAPAVAAAAVPAAAPACERARTCRVSRCEDVLLDMGPKRCQ